MFFGLIADVPKFTSFVFSRFLHAREIKPRRKNQIFNDFIMQWWWSHDGHKMSQVFLTTYFPSPSKHGWLSLVCFGLLLPNSEEYLLILSSDFFFLFFFPLFFFKGKWESGEECCSLNFCNGVYQKCILWCWQRCSCNKTKTNERMNSSVQVKVFYTWGNLSFAFKILLAFLHYEGASLEKYFLCLPLCVWDQIQQHCPDLQQNSYLLKQHLGHT